MIAVASTLKKLIPADTTADIDLMAACHFDVTPSTATVNLSLSIADLDKKHAFSEFSVSNVPIQRIYEQQRSDYPFGQHK